MDMRDVGYRGNLGQENREEREKRHFKSAGNKVRKRVGFLCLLLYVLDN